MIDNGGLKRLLLFFNYVEEISERFKIKHIWMGVIATCKSSNLVSDLIYLNTK